MSAEKDKLGLFFGPQTEDLINYIFRELSDDIVDEIDLDRISPEIGGVARELVTTGAILTFTAALAVPIFRLIERWMEQQRQREATELIYEAAKENPEVVSVLAEMEKQHIDFFVKRGKITVPRLSLK